MCKDCGAVLDKPAVHFKPETEAIHSALAANAFKGWDRLEDMPQSMWRSREPCYGALVPMNA